MEMSGILPIKQAKRLHSALQRGYIGIQALVRQQTLLILSMLSLRLAHEAVGPRDFLLLLQVTRVKITLDRAAIL